MLCSEFASVQHKKTLEGYDKQTKLEIWGKAQRESARRPKSDWGKLGGGEFPRHQSHVARTQMHWHTVTNFW